MVLSIPATPEGWRVEAMTVGGMCRAIARRSVVTLVIVGTTAEGWHVTKMRGGRVLGEREFARLPADWHRVLRRR